jgi:hypothetical protein
MEIPNAFAGRRDPPSAEEVVAALGPSATHWNKLLEEMAARFGVRDSLWKSSGLKYGWSLRLLLKKRVILYMSPCAGGFRVAFVLGDKAVEAARQSELPAPLIAELNAARRYAEGTGIRLLAKSAKDLKPILQLAAIKLEN